MAPEEQTLEETPVDAPKQRAEFASEEQRDSTLAALIREKAGYEQRGETDRAAGVQAELDRIAGKAKTGRARAEKRA